MASHIISLSLHLHPLSHRFAASFGTGYLSRVAATRPIREWGCKLLHVHPPKKIRVWGRGGWSHRFWLGELRPHPGHVVLLICHLCFVEHLFFFDCVNRGADGQYICTDASGLSSTSLSRQSRSLPRSHSPSLTFLLYLILTHSLHSSTHLFGFSLGLLSFACAIDYYTFCFVDCICSKLHFPLPHAHLIPGWTDCSPFYINFEATAWTPHTVHLNGESVVRLVGDQCSPCWWENRSPSRW